MGNDWFHEYFINELKAIGRKPTSNMQHEVVDSLPSSGNEHTIYFVKNDSSSSNNHYDEYVWISSSSTFEKIGSTQIDGSTTQPDWSQNDATQPDYIKNRPFYTGDPVETVFVEESTVSFTDTGEGFYATRFQSTFEATSGETYKVCWDGTIYECTCVIINDAPIIGNTSIAGVGSDTGEPFLMDVENGIGIMIYAAGTASSHTFSISSMVTPVVKIDPKYIRDMYYTADPVETAFVEESVVKFEDTGKGFYDAIFRTTFVPTVGETYKVTWDGTVYERACMKFHKTPIIGNLSITGEGSDTGEPFLMAIFDVGQINIVTQNTSSSHTFSISGWTTQVVKIDEKYLPDTVATKSDVEYVESIANNAQTTANNAKTAADNAQTTANNAKTAANNAKTAANNAQTTANNAKTTANNARSAANTAQSAANTALSAANNAQTTSNNAQSTADAVKSKVEKVLTVESSGNILAPVASMIKGTYQKLYLSSEDSSIQSSFGVTGSTCLQITVGRDGGFNAPVSNPSTVEFINNGGRYMCLKGIDELILNSSTANSIKKFKITVDDTGTISATEVT